MKNEQLINQVEAYVRGEMSPETRKAFELMCQENPDIEQEVRAHKKWMSLLAAYGERQRLQHAMDLIHDQIDVVSLKKELIPTSTQVIQLWRRYRANMAIAATVAIMAVFGTLLFSGYFADHSSYYKALRREINSIKRSQNALASNISAKNKRQPANPGQFGGTGFALSSNGYIVTNYHVIKDADSVYIENAAGDTYKVKPIFVQPEYDIAILHVEDSAFETFGKLPYAFKKIDSDLGEDVFTLGFPRDEPVYGKGYVSSQTGFDGDTVAYQVSIPVNPGNSGGPLLDSKGNVIGIVSGKQTRTEGASFAIKTHYLMKSIEEIPVKDLDGTLSLNKKNILSGLNRKEQLKKIQEYVFMVKVY